MKKILCFLRHIPEVLFRLLLSISASGLVVAIYLIKEGISVFPAPFVLLSYATYLFIPVILAILWLLASHHLQKCGFESEIIEVELASHSFLPNYLGYFFVALSVPNPSTLYIVYAVILIFTHLSQALSFNPIFLLFGYQFYFITGIDGTKVFLITRQKMKVYKDVELSNLRKINDFTFIDMG